jgi:DNA polymerase epsilon subunit 1
MRLRIKLVATLSSCHRWNDLTEKQKYSHLVERLKLLSRKLVKKSKISVEEIRTATVCMRENPFYVETVR